MPVSRGAKAASSSKPNPFDSDSDSEDFTSKAAKNSSTTYKAPADAKKRYKDGFRDSGGLENQSVQELENYAAYKAEETTDALSGCLRIAEDIKQDASDTLITLHKQGEQISRTHEKAVEIDQDLTKVRTLAMTKLSTTCNRAAVEHDAPIERRACFTVPLLRIIDIRPDVPIESRHFPCLFHRFLADLGRDTSGKPWRVLLQAMEAQKDEEDQGTCHGVTRCISARDQRTKGVY
jgi:hypothetical protein